MFNYLKKHPFAVEAFFEKSIVITYAFPKEMLQNLLPSHLQLDTYNDRYAFIAIAMVQTQDLRPKGFPVFMGNDFFLIGYRVFVRYTNLKGKNLRGLYILKSETDKTLMSMLGNIFSKYKYATTDISQNKTEDTILISSKTSRFNFRIGLNQEHVDLPPKSPFKDWKEARRFAGPLPFTFSVDEAKNQVLIIEGVRSNWVPKPIVVLNQNTEFFKQMHLPNGVLANAFILENIPYWWKKGEVEQW